jgi:hypothetical protein
MPVLRVAVIDFWWGNDDRLACERFLKKNRVCRGLSQLGFELQLCFPASPGSRPDLVFFGVFGTRFASGHSPADHPGAVKIFWCDEDLHAYDEFARRAGYRDEFDFSFTYDPTSSTNFRMTGIRVLADLKLLQDGVAQADADPAGRDFACFLYSNGAPGEPQPEGVRLRNDFFSRLDARRRVNSGGSLMNNIGGPVPASETDAFVARHKFVLAMENAIRPGYVTEKILHGFRNGAVPVYCGAPDIALDFDPRTFLHYTGDNFEEVVDAMFRIDSDPQAFREMLRRPKLAPQPRPEFREEVLGERIASIARSVRASLGS